MKELWVDVETTGTDPQRHGLHQVSGVIVNGGEEYFDYRFKPKDDADLTFAAFETTGTSFKEVYSRELTEANAWLNFVKLLDRHVSKYDKADKFVVFGYNVRFDYDFLYAWFKSHDRYGIGSYVWFPPIDVMNVAMLKLQHKRPDMENFKQSTVAAALDIEVDATKLHDAKYDIDLCREIYKRLTEDA